MLNALEAYCPRGRVNVVRKSIVMRIAEARMKCSAADGLASSLAERRSRRRGNSSARRRNVASAAIIASARKQSAALTASSIVKAKRNENERRVAASPERRFHAMMIEYDNGMKSGKVLFSNRRIDRM